MSAAFGVGRKRLPVLAEPTRSSRLERPLAIGLLLCQALLLAIQAWIAQRGGSGGASPESLFRSLLDALSTLSYGVVGVVILIRRPGNTIGRLFTVANLGWVVSNVAAAYAVSSLTVAGLPATPLAAWLATWPGPLSLGAYYLIALLFPDGRPLTARWRRFAWFAAGFSVAHSVMMAFGSGSVGSLQLAGITYQNPLGLGGPVGMIMGDLANGPMQIGILVLLGTSAASLILRMRRSRGIEREQLKWLTWAVVVTVGFWITNLPVMLAYDSLAAAPSWVQAWNAVTTSSGVIIAIAAGVAILRYRLYDIDRIVSRTVAWATVSVVLVVIFAAAVVGLDDLLAGVTQGGTVAVAASTLTAFALFQPLRRRVQQAVDRRFDRARYDSQRTVDAFAEGLREQVDLARINDGMLSTVASTFRPRGEAIWLRDRRT